MIRIRTTITGSDYSRRGAKKAAREAGDFAWKFHRRKIMPFHFTRSAYERYPEYSQNKPSRSGNKSRTKRDNRDGKTREVQEKRRRERAKLKRELEEKYGRTRSRQVKLPLVKTGFMRRRILKGDFKITGKPDARKITYRPPRYAFINPPKQMDKIAALTAINGKEEDIVVDVFVERFFKNLENNKKTRKGG